MMGKGSSVSFPAFANAVSHPCCRNAIIAMTEQGAVA